MKKYYAVVAGLGRKCREIQYPQQKNEITQSAMIPTT